MSPIPYKTEAPPPPAKKRRASTKPRKRRVQTLADKGAERTLLKWQEMFGSYVFNPDENINVVLAKESGKWTMTALLFGKRYIGERPVLREAWDAVNNLLYKQAKEYWLRMDSHVVSKAFPDFLKEGEHDAPTATH